VLLKERSFITTFPPRTKKPRKVFAPFKVKLFPLIVIGKAVTLKSGFTLTGRKFGNMVPDKVMLFWKLIVPSPPVFAAMIAFCN